MLGKKRLQFKAEKIPNLSNHVASSLQGTFPGLTFDRTLLKRRSAVRVRAEDHSETSDTAGSCQRHKATQSRRETYSRESRPPPMNASVCRELQTAPAWRRRLLYPRRFSVPGFVPDDFLGNSLVSSLEELLKDCLGHFQILKKAVQEPVSYLNI